MTLKFAEVSLAMKHRKRLDDGSFYVVNYMLDDAPKAQIKGCNFRLEDVILP